MIRILALLCLGLAAPAFGLSLFQKKWEKDLRIRFDVNPISFMRNKAFMQQPLSKIDAVEQGWQQKTRPDDGHDGFCSLEMWCPEGDYTLCLFYDDTGYVSGVQIALGTEEFTDGIYDWKTQGFTYWSINNGGTLENYWTTQIFFSSPEYLSRSAEDRIATRDPKKLLQDKFFYVSGINGNLHAITTTVSELATPEISNFTKQACMPMMGNHYYYKMTPELECNSELFPFFPLEFDGQVIGTGFVVFGKWKPKAGRTDYTEQPPKLAVKAIVPRGPKCLYDLADSPGLVTMHIYFINKPRDLICPIFG